MLNRISHRSHSGSPALALAIGAVLSLAAAQAVAVQPATPPDLTASSAQSVLGEGPGDYFYRSISKTPDKLSTKSKLEALTIYVPRIELEPTLDENGDPVLDELGQPVGGEEVLVAGADKVHPMIVTYTDEVIQGSSDVFAAVSRDEGSTWKRMNISHSAERAVMIDGKQYGYGTVRKPSIKTMGNLVLVSWTSKYCPSRDPTAIGDRDGDPDTGEDVEDPFLIKGPQGIVDYAETYGDEYAAFGVVPYSCVWMARGMINAADGAITWFAPEQLTSGRRDALQDWPFAAKDAGFAIVWQEDPKGLDPGQAKGPGEGMSGATVNHKTDIWYSFITKDDFTKVDLEAVTSEEALGEGKPKAAVSFSHPVRLTDNASCKVDTDANGDPLKDIDGNPVISGLPICTLERLTYCPSIVTTYRADGSLIGTFCKTSYGVVLDGDTGASRPNLFMFPKDVNKDGIIDTAEMGLAYEETKGLGEGNTGGQSEEDEEDPYADYASGKLVRYHHFPDFKDVALMQPGNIVNRPAIDPEDGVTVLVWKDENGANLTDDAGKPLYMYENARRPRFILQPKSSCGDIPVTECTTMAMVYKQGIEGQGRQSDVMMVRAKGGYAWGNFVKDGMGPIARNISSPSVLSFDTEVDSTVPKVSEYEWYEGDLQTESWANPYDDARAQRGVIRGNTLLVGISWTPNWAAARNGNDHYDFLVRWSQDGGETFVDPATGLYAGPHNVSKLKNNFSTVIEPRTIGTPNSIVQKDGSFYSPDDEQNGNVFFLAYGTAKNVDTNLGDDDESDEGESTPEDIFFTWTEDAGATYKTVLNLNAAVDPYEPVNAMLAARNDAAEGEVQLRTTPSGLKLYAVWNHDGPIDGTGGIDGSDVGFRKIENLPELYDLSGDGVVDLSDQIIFRAAMGACEGKKKFNPTMDYDNDKCITLGDYAKWSQADLADDN